jgi:hypothetical protein
LTIDGCNHLTVHSKNHFTVLVASNNGSVFAWMSRAAKLIQPLAPDFHEIERNIWYVEKEDEFELELEDTEKKVELERLEAKESKKGLVPLDERQRRLAKAQIDIENKSDGCMTKMTVLQQLLLAKSTQTPLESLF